MWGLGAGCGPAKGDGGSPDPFGYLSMPGFVSEVGECAEFARGAVSCLIEAAMVLGDVRASPDDEHVGVGFAVAARVVGVRARGVVLPFGWMTRPNELSTSVAQSNVVRAVVGVVGVGGWLDGGVLSSPLSCEVSASRITNAARKFAIAFRIPSGNGPDQVSFQSSSMRRSLVSHCATVLSDMAGSCGCVAICCAIRAVCANRL